MIRPAVYAPLMLVVLLAVMPDQELVVVRLGLTENGADSGLSRLLEAVAAALANDRGIVHG